MKNIQNAVAVVTGGASGIGRGIVESLLARGARVVVADRDRSALEQVASDLDVHIIETDVTDEQSMSALAQETIEVFGKVQILCNNAGVGPRGNVVDLSLDDWRRIMDVNLWGVIYGIHYFLPHLIKETTFAHIVNTVSISVLTPPAGLAPYVASKAGVLAISETLRQELAIHHPAVGVTALLPGPVTTNIGTSLRNLPTDSTSGLRDFDLAQKRPDWGFISPLAVGGQVVNAIDENAPYVITHEFFRQQIQQRNERILDGIV